MGIDFEGMASDRFRQLAGPAQHLSHTGLAGGFGYDPVFFVPHKGLTYAEMDKGLKSEIGHRGQAFAQLEPQLRALLGS